VSSSYTLTGLGFLSLPKKLNFLFLLFNFIESRDITIDPKGKVLLASEPKDWLLP